ncbi:MAG: hypothetical protein JXR87_01255 [Candidatus Marinimicrobia bacterium]|nr:hypothetical protein [Candidatus Neomarinimicrobiota bacterium]
MFIFILKLLLILFCALLGAVVLTILIPIRFRFNGDLSDDEKRFSGVVSLYFGAIQLFLKSERETLHLILAFIGIRIPVYTKLLKEMGQKSPEPPVKKSEKKIKKSSKSKLNVIDWITIVRKVFPRLIRPIQFKTLSVDLAVGFSNPVATGLFISTYYIFKYTIKKMETVALRGDFKRTGVFGEITIDGIIYLVQYVAVLIFVYKQYRQRLRIKKKGGYDG